MSVKLIFEPTIHLVGRQVIDEQALTAFLAANDVEHWETDTDVAAEKIIETAGRVCYMSFAKPRPGGNRAYAGHLLEVGHGSVLEHAVFNFIIEGVSRSLTHELIRHRAGFGYSQLSQRFVDESEADFVVPPALADEVKAARAFLAAVGRARAIDVSPDIRNMNRKKLTHDVEAGLGWLEALESAQVIYGQLSDYLAWKCIGRSFPQDDVESTGAAKAWLKRHPDQATRFRKQAREAARSVLPNATETKIFVTGNVRALRHFIAMRGSPEADVEIRRLAVGMAKILIDAAPNLFQDVHVIRGIDGAYYVEIGHPKV